MKAQKKQTKKAVTLLTKTEKLLADVLVECEALEKSVEKNFRGLVHAAEAAIAAAKEFVTPGPTAESRPRTGHGQARPKAARARKHPAVRAKRRPIARAA